MLNAINIFIINSMNPSLCGDLLRFISLFINDKSKIKIIQTSKNIKKICYDTYLFYILNIYVDQKEYNRLELKFKKHIHKLKNVQNDLDAALPLSLTHLILNDTDICLTNRLPHICYI